MRKLFRKPVAAAVQGTAQPFTLPAPIGGWNARDPLSAMPRTDAVILDNFFPGTTSVDLRKGFALFATLPADVYGSTPHNVRSLLSYSAPSGTKKFFAGADDGLYDITAGGVVGAISSAATNNEWQSTNITTSGGSFLWCCNGVDKSRVFNGAAWTLLDGVSTPALTGVTSADIANVDLFKSRLIFCVKNSLSFYYLPVDSIAGLAAAYPLGALVRDGGYLMATATWTIDGGNGPDDYFVAVTSEGELLVYAGTDPSNATAWGLRGRYKVARPLNRRCFVEIAGDLCIMTVEGLISLSKLPLAGSDRTSAISDKISKAWETFLDSYGTLYGWQPLVYNDAKMLVVNVPVLSDHSIPLGVYSYQFVMNTQTKAWCRFSGMPAEVFGVHDKKLYFALNNKVYQAWTGTEDNGASIQATGKTAFTHFGTKSWPTMVRAIVQSARSLNITLGVDADYDEAAFTTSTLSYAQSLALWDIAKWDRAYWSAGSSVLAKWRKVNARPGSALAVRLRVNGKGITMAWTATELLVNKGRVL